MRLIWFPLVNRTAACDLVSHIETKSPFPTPAPVPGSFSLYHPYKTFPVSAYNSGDLCLLSITPGEKGEKSRESYS